MIIKKMDSKQEEIRELTALLKGRLTSYQRFLIKRELRAMKSGVRGEEDSAYYIDFYFGNSRFWAVIHDLRLEHEDQVAQIDHLLMNRLYDIYVLESKNYSYKVKITPEGEFQAYSDKEYYGIPSPLEQNKRHVHLLDRFLKDHDILPKRIGIPIRPRFKDFVLVSPKPLIIRPPEGKFDTSHVIRADSLRTRIDQEVNKRTPLADLASIAKFQPSSVLKETARRLASFHKPQKADLRARFRLPPQTVPEYFCSKCNKAISERVANFCLQNKAKFGGDTYCFDCQKGF